MSTDLVLVVEVGALPVERLDDALALGEAGGGCAVQRRVVGVGVLEVDGVGRQGLLGLRHVGLSVQIAIWSTQTDIFELTFDI